MTKQSDSRYTVHNFIISLLGTLLFPSLLSDTSTCISNSVFSILFFLCLFLLLNTASNSCFHSKRHVFCSISLGTLFSIMIGFGYALKVNGEVMFHNCLFILAILIYSYIFGIILNYAWTIIDTTDVAVTNIVNSVLSFIFNHPYLLVIFFFICWFPCFLGIFPGGFIYDATREFYQVTDGFNQNFPMLHSYIVIKLLSTSYSLTGGYNTGIAIYAIIQMLAFAILFMQIAKEFYQENVHPYLIIIIISYCAFFPLIPMFTTYILRDIMFGGLLTASIFLVFLMTRDPIHFFSSSFRVVETALILALTLISRNNNAGTVVIILVIILSLLICFSMCKYSIKGASILSISLVTIFIIVSKLLSSFCTPITPATAGASMSLFSQQLARTYILTGEEWSEEDISELNSYMFVEGLSYAYTPEDADNTKHRLDINNRVPDFLKFWAKIGLRYPGIYVDAALANTRQMWDPDSIIDGYNKGSTAYDSFDKCYYAYWSGIEEPGVYMNIAPKINAFYNKIGLYISFERIPVISMLFSIGFQFWFVLFCLFKNIASKNRTLYLPIMILLLYSIICAFVPLILARYFCALFLAFPITFILTFSKRAHN